MSLEIKQDKPYCYLLLCFFILYHSQGVLIPKGSIIGQILLIVIYLMSIFYILKLLLTKERFTGLMKLWLLFTVMNIFYFLITADYVNEYNILRQILLNFLPFFPFYYFAKKRILTRQVLILFMVVLLPILIIKFFITGIEMRETFGREEVIDNSIYPLIGFLPFVLLFRKKVVSFSVLLLMWFVMVQSNKRAAIICGALAFIFFIYQTIYASKAKVKFQSFFMAGILLIGITYFAYDFYESNVYLQQRVDLMLEGDSSGRDRLIEGLFLAYYQSDHYVNYLFGLGFNSAREYTTNVAHNDWIDMLGSFGLLGLVMYFLIWRSLTQEVLKKGWMKDKKTVMILTISIAFITSMTFRWYQSPFPYMNAILLPYLLATQDREF